MGWRRNIYDNRNATYGINTSNNEWKTVSEIDNALTNVFETEVSLVGVQLATGFDLEINSIESSYIKDGVEYQINFEKDFIKRYIHCNHSVEDEKVWKIWWNKEDIQQILRLKKLIL